jgi:hypothetical protein
MKMRKVEFGVMGVGNQFMVLAAVVYNVLVVLISS